MERDDFADAPPVQISGLAPLAPTETIPRVPRTLPVPDLSAYAKLWELIGEGGTGKTTIARYFLGRLIEADKLGAMVLAALAPGNRNLASFADTVMQPPSVDPKATAAWAAKLVGAQRKRRRPGIHDYGGGDTAKRHLIAMAPRMVEEAEEAGLAVVAAYTLSPRLDDLAFLKTYEAAGYRPRATALILNLARAETPGAFNDLRRQPEYRAALDRGAVELFMPALPQKIALKVERARVQFGQALGDSPANLGLLEQTELRIWLDRMEEEFRAVETWLPWA